MRAFPLFLLLLATAAIEAAAAPADVVNNLVFRRQGGTTITFAATTKSFAWCGPYDPGDAKTTTVHVITYDTTLTTGTHWRLWAIPADVVIGEPQLFPNHWIWPNPDSVQVFVGDPPNEAASDTEESGGWIVFQKLDCAEGGQIEFTIDAQIGSEYGDSPWITVQGNFRATLSASPFVPARPSTWGAVKATYR
jgi:hypothetical protein